MPKSHIPEIPFAPVRFQLALLKWYAGSRRDLPWRTKPGDKADPYRVWLSEIMLQQTTVKAVIPYYEKFIAKWPTAAALATAPRDEVLAAWAGLGYYARARNLHACAQVLVTSFPLNEAGLRQLPGIGAYTAAAIAAIAFGEPAAVVDGNVERVLARLFALDTPLPSAKPLIKALAAKLTPASNPGDYAQGMMDLGATVCTPRAPSCKLCPAGHLCAAHARGMAERYPLRVPKSRKPVRRGMAFVIVRKNGTGYNVLLRRRPDKGLLGGMMEVPSTEWAGGESAVGNAPNGSAGWKFAGMVKHTFTHFHLELDVVAAKYNRHVKIAEALDGEWIPLEKLAALALPAVMQKAIKTGLSALSFETTHSSAGSAASSASNVSTVERSARPSTKAGRK